MLSAMLLLAAANGAPVNETIDSVSPGPLERGDAPPELLVPGRALLKLAADAELDKIAERAGVDIVPVRDVVLGWLLVDVVEKGGAFPSEERTLELIARIAKDPMIADVSPEHWWRPLIVPNDPGLDQMWHFDIIDAQEAWDITQGLSTQRIGIADTGLVRGHEDVGARAVRGFDFISSASAGNDGNGRDSNFEDAGDSCGSPSSFHGTHVAGTIGAAANNGRGVAGLNWNAGLVVARVLGRCGGSSVDILEGAAWMAGAQINGVQSIGADKVSVMNLSLGGPNACSSFEQQVVDFVDQQGTVFVAAAGNDGGPVGAPANCARAVTVAAFGPSGQLASYSSFGSQVEIVAPGGDFGGGVLSTIGPSTAGYAFNQGTSMAAPHVTGAVSLLQAVAPGLTRAQIVSALQSSGVTCGNCGGVPALNIPASLAAVGVQQTTPPPPAPPPVTDDIFEDNDTLANATTARCNVDDSRLVAAPADQDFFTFTPPPGVQVTVSISAANGADLDLYVTNASGTVLARSESATGNETIGGRASGTRLGVMVNPYVDPNTGTRNTGPYRLRIICTSTAAFDPGEEDQFGSVVSAEAEVVGEERVALLPEPTLPEEEVEENLQVSAPFDVEGGCSSSPIAPSLLALIGLATIRRRRM